MKNIINILSADKKYSMRYNTETTELTIFRVKDLKTMLHVSRTGLPLKKLKTDILDRFDEYRSVILEDEKWHDVRK